MKMLRFHTVQHNLSAFISFERAPPLDLFVYITLPCEMKLGIPRKSKLCMVLD